MTKLPKKVPDEADWKGYDCDIEVRWFHKLAFGKSNEEIQNLFEGGNAIERSDELLYSPKPIFQYYVFGFAQYVLSEASENNPDAASAFLCLLEAREERDPGSVSGIYEGPLSDAVDFIASHQNHFDADINIYGDFREKAALVHKTCKSQGKAAH